MEPPDEYDFMVLKVLRAIDYTYKIGHQTENLNYALSMYSANNVHFQPIFKRLEKDGIISLEKPTPSLFDNPKDIGIIIKFSIVNKKAFDKLFSELSKKYENDPRFNNSKISITINKKGIYLSVDKTKIYEVDGKRREIINVLTDGMSHKLKTLVNRVNPEKSEKYIIDAIAGINERFSKNVVGIVGAKIIISTKQGYSLNMDQYHIKLF
jgi:hypothetical protein